MYCYVFDFQELFGNLSLRGAGTPILEDWGEGWGDESDRVRIFILSIDMFNNVFIFQSFLHAAAAPGGASTSRRTRVRGRVLVGSWVLVWMLLLRCSVLRDMLRLSSSPLLLQIL